MPGEAYAYTSQVASKMRFWLQVDILPSNCGSDRCILKLFFALNLRVALIPGKDAGFPETCLDGIFRGPVGNASGPQTSWNRTLGAEKFDPG